MYKEPMTTGKYYTGRAFQFGMFLLEFGYEAAPINVKRAIDAVSVDITTGHFVCHTKPISILRRDQMWI